MVHIYGLSEMVYNAAVGKPNVRPASNTPENFSDLRALTLKHCVQASEAFSGADMNTVSKMEITFSRGDSSSSFPLWNLMNGPLADAIYHVGQIVGYRRAAGNPQDPTVNVFMGKNRGR